METLKCAEDNLDCGLKTWKNHQGHRYVVCEKPQNFLRSDPCAAFPYVLGHNNQKP